MTLNKELDLRLRTFINAPDNFLECVGLVNALHQYPVLVGKDLYAIEVDGVKVVPVFTDYKDLNQFKTEQESAQIQVWREQSALTVLEDVIKNGLSGLVFNLKKVGDFTNSTIFKSSDMIQFINNFTTILNTVMSDDNQSAETMDKFYFVPAFVLPKDNQFYDRLFPTMATPEGKSYVPAFSNLQSLAKWYNQDDFGGAFRRGKGTILTWKIDDIYKPRNGENDIDETFGVAINPLDDQQILIDWSEIDN